MTTIRRTARSLRLSASLLGLGLIVAAGAYVINHRQEVWLTVPEALRGADVYADDLLVGRIDDPSLTYLVFWRVREALEVRHGHYRPIRVPLARGQSYPAVSESVLIVRTSIPASAPPIPASPASAARSPSR